mgnify:CR=1 FL=1
MVGLTKDAIKSGILSPKDGSTIIKKQIDDDEKNKNQQENNRTILEKQRMQEDHST